MSQKFALILSALGLSVGLTGYAGAEPITTALAQSDVTALTSVTTHASDATALGQADATGPESAATYIFMKATSTNQTALALSVAISSAGINSIGDLASNPEIQAGINDLASIFSVTDTSGRMATAPVPEPTSLVVLSTAIVGLGLCRMRRVK
ncbi:MAG: PEP-CTERM sorting domain-containing protein [Pseudomonadota bacterium]|nr:PEP-CTERM sorting domain-containing protein [Pseudomonadota bacterium]